MELREKDFGRRIRFKDGQIPVVILWFDQPLLHRKKVKGKFNTDFILFQIRVSTLLFLYKY